jgi:site-specific DNA recombinase
MAASRSVTVIPARKLDIENKDEEKPKLRVAAYCRVSTDSEEQATSYETQIDHYTAYIQGHPDWVLAGIFADDGLTGTNFDRPQFQRMIDDVRNGRINCVVVKDCCAIMGLNQKDLENQGILA